MEKKPGLVGCYLLIVLGEPLCEDHKERILQKVAKGLLSWDTKETDCDLKHMDDVCRKINSSKHSLSENEILIQHSTDKMAVEVLLNPQLFTLKQCLKNLLLAPTGHKHLIHAGYSFTGSGSWMLHDGIFKFQDFADAFEDKEVESFLQKLPRLVTVHVHCAPVGEWVTTNYQTQKFSKLANVMLNPSDSSVGVQGAAALLDFFEASLKSLNVQSEMHTSQIVGNIRFNRPTLYVFPSGQGDCCLFGVTGFTMLIDGGFTPLPCFWNFVRHLERLDSIMVTRLNESNLWGVSSFFKKKVLQPIYPHIGYIFCNITEGKASPTDEMHKDRNELLVSVIDIGQKILGDLKTVGISPHQCLREPCITPLTLYHKVGHGTLDMFILSPPRESRILRDFLQQWSTNKESFSFVRTNSASQSGQDIAIPISHVMSICCLLIWRPAEPSENITRMLFPGSAPQSRIFEGLEKIKHLDVLCYPVCSRSSLRPVVVGKPQPKTSADVTYKAVPRFRSVSPLQRKIKSVKQASVESNKGDSSESLSSPLHKKLQQSKSVTQPRKEMGEDKKAIESVDKRSKTDEKTIKKAEKSVVHKSPVRKAKPKTTIKSVKKTEDLKKLPIKKDAMDKEVKNKYVQEKDFDNKDIDSLEDEKKDSEKESPEPSPKKQLFADSSKDDTEEVLQITMTEEMSTEAADESLESHSIDEEKKDSEKGSEQTSPKKSILPDHLRDEIEPDSLESYDHDADGDISKDSLELSETDERRVSTEKVDDIVKSSESSPTPTVNTCIATDIRDEKLETSVSSTVISEDNRSETNEATYGIALDKSLEKDDISEQFDEKRSDEHLYETEQSDETPRSPVCTVSEKSDEALENQLSSTIISEATDSTQRINTEEDYKEDAVTQKQSEEKTDIPKDKRKSVSDVTQESAISTAEEKTDVPDDKRKSISDVDDKTQEAKISITEESETVKVEELKHVIESQKATESFEYESKSDTQIQLSKTDEEEKFDQKQEKVDISEVRKSSIDIASERKLSGLHSALTKTPEQRKDEAEHELQTAPKLEDDISNDHSQPHPSKIDEPDSNKNIGNIKESIADSIPADELSLEPRKESEASTQSAADTVIAEDVSDTTSQEIVSYETVKKDSVSQENAPQHPQSQETLKDIGKASDDAVDQSKISIKESASSVTEKRTDEISVLPGSYISVENIQFPQSISSDVSAVDTCVLTDIQDEKVETSVSGTLVSEENRSETAETIQSLSKSLEKDISVEQVEVEISPEHLDRTEEPAETSRSSVYTVSEETGEVLENKIISETTGSTQIIKPKEDSKDSGMAQKQLDEETDIPKDKRKSIGDLTQESQISAAEESEIAKFEDLKYKTESQKTAVSFDHELKSDKTQILKTAEEKIDVQPPQETTDAYKSPSSDVRKLSIDVESEEKLSATHSDVASIFPSDKVDHEFQTAHKIEDVGRDQPEPQTTKSDEQVSTENAEYIKKSISELTDTSFELKKENVEASLSSQTHTVTAEDVTDSTLKEIIPDEVIKKDSVSIVNVSQQQKPEEVEENIGSAYGDAAEMTKISTEESASRVSEKKTDELIVAGSDLLRETISQSIDSDIETRAYTSESEEGTEKEITSKEEKHDLGKDLITNKSTSKGDDQRLKTTTETKLETEVVSKDSYLPDENIQQSIDSDIPAISTYVEDEKLEITVISEDDRSKTTETSQGASLDKSLEKDISTEKVDEKSSPEHLYGTETDETVCTVSEKTGDVLESQIISETSGSTQIIKPEEDSKVDFITKKPLGEKTDIPKDKRKSVSDVTQESAISTAEEKTDVPGDKRKSISDVDDKTQEEKISITEESETVKVEELKHEIESQKAAESLEYESKSDTETQISKTDEEKFDQKQEKVDISEVKKSSIDVASERKLSSPHSALTSTTLEECKNEAEHESQTAPKLEDDKLQTQPPKSEESSDYEFKSGSKTMVSKADEEEKFNEKFEKINTLDDVRKPSIDIPSERKQSTTLTASVSAPDQLKVGSDHDQSLPQTSKGDVKESISDLTLADNLIKPYNELEKVEASPPTTTDAAVKSQKILSGEAVTKDSHSDVQQKKLEETEENIGTASNQQSVLSVSEKKAAEVLVTSDSSLSTEKARSSQSTDFTTRAVDTCIETDNRDKNLEISVSTALNCKDNRSETIQAPQGVTLDKSLEKNDISTAKVDKKISPEYPHRAEQPAETSRSSVSTVSEETGEVLESQVSSTIISEATGSTQIIRPEEEVTHKQSVEKTDVPKDKRKSVSDVTQESAISTAEKRSDVPGDKRKSISDVDDKTQEEKISITEESETVKVEEFKHEIESQKAAESLEYESKSDTETQISKTDEEKIYQKQEKVDISEVRKSSIDVASERKLSSPHSALTSTTLEECKNEAEHESQSAPKLEDDKLQTQPPKSEESSDYEFKSDSKTLLSKTNEAEEFDDQQKKIDTSFDIKQSRIDIPSERKPSSTLSTLVSAPDQLKVGVERDQSIPQLSKGDALVSTKNVDDKDSISDSTLADNLIKPYKECEKFEASTPSTTDTVVTEDITSKEILSDEAVMKDSHTDVQQKKLEETEENIGKASIEQSVLSVSEKKVDKILVATGSSPSAEKTHTSQSTDSATPAVDTSIATDIRNEISVSSTLTCGDNRSETTEASHGVALDKSLEKDDTSTSKVDEKSSPERLCGTEPPIETSHSSFGTVSEKSGEVLESQVSSTIISEAAVSSHIMKLEKDSEDDAVTQKQSRDERKSISDVIQESQISAAEESEITKVEHLKRETESQEVTMSSGYELRCDKISKTENIEKIDDQQMKVATSSNVRRSSVGDKGIEQLKDETESKKIIECEPVTDSKSELSRTTEADKFEVATHDSSEVTTESSRALYSNAHVTEDKKDIIGGDVSQKISFYEAIEKEKQDCISQSQKEQSLQDTNKCCTEIQGSSREGDRVSFEKPSSDNAKISGGSDTSQSSMVSPEVIKEKSHYAHQSPPLSKMECDEALITKMTKKAYEPTSFEKSALLETTESEEDEEMIRHPTPPDDKDFYEKVGYAAGSSELTRLPSSEMPSVHLRRSSLMAEEVLYEKPEDEDSTYSDGAGEKTNQPDEPQFGKISAEYAEEINVSGGTTPSTTSEPQSPYDPKILSRGGSLKRNENISVIKEAQRSEGEPSSESGVVKEYSDIVKESQVILGERVEVIGQCLPSEVEEPPLIQGSSQTVETVSSSVISTTSISSVELPVQSQASDEDVKKTLEEWGKPLGLPTLPESATLTSKTRASSAVRYSKTSFDAPKSLASKQSSKYGKDANESLEKPVYLDLAYVPHHGDMHYCNSDFFKKVRARFYVFSATNPSKEVFDALIDGKKCWDNKDAEVTVIPTHETETLSLWMSARQDMLEKYKIDVAPSASRCTVTLQDHETTCAAYRLEF